MRPTILVAFALTSASAAQTVPVPPAAVFQAKPLFTLVPGPRPGFGSRFQRFADIDGDGVLDSLMTGVRGLQVWKGQGHGAFAPYVLYPPPWPWWGATADVADVDGDGDVDVLQATKGPQPCSIMLNDGAGIFTVGPPAPFPGGAPIGPCLGRLADLDRDGDADIIFLAPRMRAFFNDGSGAFIEDPSAMPAVQQNLSDVQFADLDGDGDIDFVTANGSWGPIEPDYAFFNDGRGHFHTYVPLHASQVHSVVVRTLDFDGDGDRDVLIVPLVDQSLLLRNEGGGVFTDVSDRLSRWTTTQTLHAAAVGDIDMDGHVDIVRASGNVLYLDRNRGDGTFEPKSPEHFWGSPTINFLADDGLYLVDVDQDGDLDLYLGQGLGTDIYWGAAVHLQAPGASTLGATTTLHLFGFDGLAALAMCGPRLTAPLRTPFGHLWLDPATTVVDPATIVVPPTGIATRTLRVPNVGALRGRTAHFQALHLAPRRGWTRLTNLAWTSFQ